MNHIDGANEIRFNQRTMNNIVEKYLNETMFGNQIGLVKVTSVQRQTSPVEFVVSFTPKDEEDVTP